MHGYTKINFLIKVNEMMKGTNKSYKRGKVELTKAKNAKVWTNI